MRAAFVFAATTFSALNIGRHDGFLNGGIIAVRAGDEPACFLVSEAVIAREPGLETVPVRTLK